MEYFSNTIDDCCLMDAGFEALSRGLSSLFEANPQLYYRINGGCKGVSHLSYADDAIIYMACDKSGLILLKDFLNTYEQLSGQRINLAKSDFIVGIKMSEANTSLIKGISCFSQKDLPISYLGAPLHKGKEKEFFFLN
ncbi:hypothetical protein BUALT_Bualt19G0048300 [Buddleja alternifolia]|uniref:Reverse transcriptase n=1 Tax=Buddleja alternifolia TaxID=168488 RepID=A0AAV6W5C5_9LAMI|nr:hypothetical protein BUALT_Bualt19G0048300 [Buddleja alternifolia]